MEFCTTIFITLLAIISQIHLTTASSSSQNYTNFIINSCKTTTYPPLCLKTLTPYASSVKYNHLKLCKVALSVAISTASNCSASVSRLASQKGITRPVASAIKECIGDMKDVIYELKQTVAAMRLLNGQDRQFQWDNAKTYASAAITDADTCIDAVLEKKVDLVVNKKIKSCVNGVEKVISNALYLINNLY